MKTIRIQRHSARAKPLYGAVLAAAFLFVLTSPALATSVPEPETGPEWCRCETLDDAVDEEVRAGLLTAMRDEQALCRKAMGVSPYEQRQGQGAKIDACACECLDAETHEGPWGKQPKPMKQGKG